MYFNSHIFQKALYTRSDVLHKLFWKKKKKGFLASLFCSYVWLLKDSLCPLMLNSTLNKLLSWKPQRRALQIKGKGLWKSKAKPQILMGASTFCQILDTINEVSYTDTLWGLSLIDGPVLDESSLWSSALQQVATPQSTHLTAPIPQPQQENIECLPPSAQPDLLTGLGDFLLGFLSPCWVLSHFLIN